MRTQPMFISRCLSFLIGLTILPLAPVDTGLAAQATPGGYGCLNVFRSGLIGRYDLANGTYTDLAVQQGNWRASPDGRHVTYLDGTETLIIASNDNNREQIIRLPDFPWVSQTLRWSPDSHYVALSLESSEHTAKLIVASPDKGAQWVTDIASYAVGAAPSMSWSPDSRHISIAIDGSFEADSGYYTADVSLYGIDGSVRSRVAEKAVGYMACGEICDSYPLDDWSRDGASLLYVRYTPGSKRQFDVLAYRLDEQRRVTLARGLSDFPVFRGDKKYALIQWQVQAKTFAGVLDLATQDIHTLDSYHSLVDLKWLNDKALARWETYLVWSNADGTGQHQLDIAPAHLVNGPSTVEVWQHGSYGWSLDGHWLVLATTGSPLKRSRDSRDLQVIDLRTGSARTFTDLSIPDALIDGRFISPDGRIALVLRAGRLYLLFLEDGNLREVNFDPPGSLPTIHQFVWSPDNAVFVIVPGGVGNLYLVDSHGKLLRRYENFPDFGDPLIHSVAWSNCQE